MCLLHQWHGNRIHCKTFSAVQQVSYRKISFNRLRLCSCQIRPGSWEELKKDLQPSLLPQSLGWKNRQYLWYLILLHLFVQIYQPMRIQLIHLSLFITEIYRKSVDFHWLLVLVKNVFAGEVGRRHQEKNILYALGSRLHSIYLVLLQ